MRETLRGPADRPDAAGGGEGLENQELKLGTPMTGVLDFSDRLTRERNEKYLRTDSRRIRHLVDGGGEVVDTLERVTDPSKLEEVLPDVAAKVTLRAFTVLQGLQDKEGILKALMKKYPESGCSYCGHKPCLSAIARPEEKKGAQSSEAQKSWTIREWQDHLGSVYGENNAKRGQQFTLLRLVSEINEANKASLQAEIASDTEDTEHVTQFTQEEISELADAFAWIIGVCNVAGIDLEKAYVERYGNGCPNCGQFSCQCGPFTFVQERKVSK